MARVDDTLMAGWSTGEKGINSVRPGALYKQKYSLS